MAVAAAQREAARRRDQLLLPAHLLVGLFEEGSPDGAGILLQKGLTADRVRALARRSFAPEVVWPGTIPGFSVPAVDVLGLAAEYADATGHELVEPGHLLAGIVDVVPFDEMLLGHTLLERCGLDDESLRQEMFRRFHEEESPERRSIAHAAEAFSAHPGARSLERLTEGVVRLHESSLHRGDYQAAVLLRWTLRQLATDRREPLDRWVAHAESTLEDTLDTYGGGGEEERRGAGPGPRNQGMFDKLTERARKVVVHAREEALARGDPEIRPAHLLVGLAAVPGGIARRVLSAHGVTAKDARTALDRVAGQGRPEPRARPLPFSGPCLASVLRAEEVAEDLARDDVDTEHLLLGVSETDADTDDAAEVLRVLELLEVPRAAMRREVFRLVHERGTASQRSLAWVRRDMMSHPAMWAYGPVIEKFLAAHAEAVRRGRWEHAARLRGTMERAWKCWPESRAEDWPEQVRADLEFTMGELGLRGRRAHDD